MQLAYLRAKVGAAAAILLYFNTISDVVASFVESGLIHFLPTRFAGDIR
jgi:hypothetical protein